MTTPLQDKRTDAKSVLSRAGLLSSITSMNLLSLVPPEVKAVYSLMTEEFAPLDMETRLEPLLAQISTIQVGGGVGRGQGGEGGRVRAGGQAARAARGSAAAELRPG